MLLFLLRNLDFIYICILLWCKTIEVANGRKEYAIREEEEKQHLIERILELQSTLGDLSKKVHDVKNDNLKLKSNNSVLSSFIENLMSTSSVFQSAWNKQNFKKN